jgi:hypothetical protein
MSPRLKFPGQRVLAVVAIALVPCATLPAASPGVKRVSSYDLAALEGARAGAARRLERPECQKILTDFTDAKGRALLANLESWGLSPSEYLLQAITFRDGSDLPGCGKRTVQLVTVPGQPPVFVCPATGAVPGSRFARIHVEKPTLAEVMVIHEMLHTLGLGENPPTTFEITDRVMARCH